MQISSVKNFDFYLFDYANGYDLEVEPQFKKITVSANDVTPQSNFLAERKVVFISHKQRAELPESLKSNQAFMDFLQACSLMVNIEYLPSDVLEEMEADELKPGLALQLLENSARAGNALAQLNLSKIYESAKGVMSDRNIALQHLRSAANQNLASAQYRLGQYYYSGKVIPQDYKEAVRLFRLAANAGMAEGMHALGCCYLRGNGVPKDPGEAYTLIRRASLKGMPEAVESLNYLNANGIGVQVANEPHLMTFLDYHFMKPTERNSAKPFSKRSVTRLNIKDKEDYLHPSTGKTRSAPKRQRTKRIV
jgi:hypothetical protein